MKEKKKFIMPLPGSEMVPSMMIKLALNNTMQVELQNEMRLFV